LQQARCASAIETASSVPVAPPSRAATASIPTLAMPAQGDDRSKQRAAFSGNANDPIAFRLPLPYNGLAAPRVL